MENFVIAITRTSGSGATSIGRILAKNLGVELYDRNLLRLASDDSGISQELFARADEDQKQSLLFRVSQKVYKGGVIPPEREDFTSNNNLFNYQAKVIKDLAATESCVIVGRCADFVLKDYPNVVSVFIHADEKFCLEQAMERNSMTTKEMQKYIEKTDKYRGDFYKYYTGHEGTDARNYHLCLDSGKLGFQKCVEEIKAYMKIRFDQE